MVKDGGNNIMLAIPSTDIWERFSASALSMGSSSLVMTMGSGGGMRYFQYGACARIVAWIDATALRDGEQCFLRSQCEQPRNGRAVVHLVIVVVGHLVAQQHTNTGRHGRADGREVVSALHT